jgi:lysozyme
MNTGTKGIELIKNFESLHDGDLSKIGLQPKMCPAGIWTEGYGHAIINPETGKFLKGKENEDLAQKLAKIKDPNTEDYIEAEMILKKDLIKFESIINAKIKIQINQNQFDALVSHTFNTGGSDTLFLLINSEKDCGSWWLNHYITASGKILPGLIRRRKAEFELFKS